MKPKIPIQAQARWTMGLSSVTPDLAPSLERKAIRLNRMKEMVEGTSATPMNAGVVAVGADNQRDMSLGSTERSKWETRSGSTSISRRSQTDNSRGSGRELCGWQIRRCLFASRIL